MVSRGLCGLVHYSCLSYIRLTSKRRPIYVRVRPVSSSGTHIRRSAHIIVRSDLCTADQLGQFITSYPSDHSNTSSIYTTALHFGQDPSSPPEDTTPVSSDSSTSPSLADDDDEINGEAAAAASEAGLGYDRRYKNASDPSSYPSSSSFAASYGPQTYSGPITYSVDKTGYYCVGELPPWYHREIKLTAQASSPSH